MGPAAKNRGQPLRQGGRRTPLVPLCFFLLVFSSPLQAQSTAPSPGKGLRPGSSASEERGEEVNLPPPSQRKTVDRIVAITNDEIITLYDLMQAGAPIFDRIAAEYEGAAREAKMKAAMSDLLDKMIDYKLIEQQARKIGITVAEKEIDRQLEELKKSQNLTQEQLEMALARDGMTLADYRKEIRTRLLTSRYVEYLVRQRVKITEEKLRQYYTQNLDRFRQSGGGDVRIADLFLPYPQGDATGKEEVIEEARRIRQEIAAGLPFMEAVRKYSEGYNIAEGGDLGFLELDQLQPEFREALEGLEPGEISDPIETERGLHLLQLIEVRNAPILPFEQVKSQIMSELYQKEYQKMLSNLSQEL
ncbi:MAG: hypothetical protein D6795_16465, partial [Deltaproteobacteria bacterium]